MPNNAIRNSTPSVDYIVGLLEMLEGSSDTCRVEDSAVHNDHSYTTPLSSPMKQTTINVVKASQIPATLKLSLPTQSVTSSAATASISAIQPTVTVRVRKPFYLQFLSSKFRLFLEINLLRILHSMELN